MTTSHRIISLTLLALLAPLALAQTVVEFWHAQRPQEEIIQRFADEFNARQNEVRVVPRFVGGYPEASIKLVAALSAGDAPVLFDAETTVFSRLAEEGSLIDLSALAAGLDEALVADFYPVQWEYGQIGDARLGLPWNMSMPVLFYNASAFEQRGVTPPATWQEFEAAAERLTTRNTKGYIDVAAAFIFEAMVSTRGGSILTDEGRPNFDSAEAIDALTMLQRLARGRSSIPRGFAELDQALVDFARTKAMMAIASQAFFPEGERFSVAFEVASAPLPVGSSRAIPLMGAQLVVLSGASEAQARGAFDFWRFLMEPDIQSRWVQDSYFLPVRRSVAEGLSSWYDEAPNRRSALDQLEQAVPRPRVGAYAIWQGYLEEAIERVTKGRADPAQALGEAQRRALETR